MPSLTPVRNNNKGVTSERSYYAVSLFGSLNSSDGHGGLGMFG